MMMALLNFYLWDTRQLDDGLEGKCGHRAHQLEVNVAGLNSASPASHFYHSEPG